MSSRFTSKLSPEKPHLSRGEIADLRHDMYEAFARVAKELDEQLGSSNQNTLTTEGDDPTVILAVEIPQWSTVYFEAVFVGQQRNGVHRARYYRTFTVYRDDGDAVLVDPVVVPVPDFETDPPAMDALIETSGTSLVLKVSGKRWLIFMHNTDRPQT